MALAFNTDILLSEADREHALAAFPDVFFALDSKDAREAFAPYDERANVSKTRSRRWGVFAVFLAAGALLMAGGEMLYQDLPKTQLRIVAAIGGVAGVVSVVIGVFGIMYRKRKMRWLADRLATERIRQFHFQTYVMGAGDVLKGAKSPEAAEEFQRRRAADFKAFDADTLSNVDEILHRLVHAEDHGDGRIIERAAFDVSSEDPHLEQYLSAYETLRFERQIDYCNLILREGEGFWKHAPMRQAKILGRVAMACVFAIFGLHGLVLVGALADIGWMKGPLVHVFAIWAAIIALAARTFEEGFQPEREIERMRQYRLSLRRIHARFKGARTPREKFAAMRDLETLSYEEMVLFLRGNYEAQFVM